MADTAFVASQPEFLSAPIPGGVQVCTAEYVELLKAAGFEVAVHPVSQRRDPAARLAARLGFDAYGGYDFAQHAAQLARMAAARPGAVIALNQVDLAPLAAILRRLAPAVPVVMLSHGNSSGDYLHDADQGGQAWPARLRHRWRVGELLAREASFFQNDIDLVLCLSDTEAAIDQWLGARHVLVVPRTFHDERLDWSPVERRVGIVATVNHHPNRAGIETFAAALQAAGVNGVAVRLVGSGAAAGGELQAQFPFIEYLGQLDDAALRAEAATWSLFVHPLFWHARGASTKVATAVGWGLPIATTPAGLRGYRWREGAIATAIEPLDLARLVSGLVNDRSALEAARADVLRVAGSGPTLQELGVELRAAVEAARRRRAASAAGR